MNKKCFLLNKKGFSFTFDAVFAIIVLSAALLFISSNISGANLSLQNSPQKIIAEDALDICFEKNILQTLNQTTIENFISNIIPANYDYSITINEYSYGSGFTLDTTYSFGNTTADLNYIDYVESKKIFLEYTNGDISKYYSANIRVWVG